MRIITLLLLTLFLSSCGRAPTDEQVRSQNPEVEESDDFGARVIERFESNQSEADQIIERVNLSTEDEVEPQDSDEN
jgi:PBP1b-binding outer membrane lipoprotein LpoB